MGNSSEVILPGSTALYPAELWCDRTDVGVMADSIAQKETK